MNTATLVPPPRPPRNGNIAGAVGEPDSGSTFGGRCWWRMGLKLAVVIVLLAALGLLASILFR